VGEYTFAIFAVTVIALVLSWLVLGLLRALPRHAAAEGQAGVGEHHEHFDTPVLPALPRDGGLVRGAPLDHHRRDAADFALGIVGMGKVQQQFFPDSSRPEILVDIWFAEGTSFAANEDVAKRSSSACCACRRVDVTTWVGSGVPRFYLPLDQIFPQPTCRS
jgi:multidrug efflux pump subunit AcrB